MDQSGKESLIRDFWRAGHFDRAEQLAHDVLQDDPQSETAHYYLARVLMYSDRLKEAKPHLDIILGLSPDYAWNHHALTIYHRQRGKPKDALSTIEHAIELSPQEPAFHCTKAQIHLALDELPQARAAAQIAHELDPLDAHYKQIWIETSALGKPNASDALRRIMQLRETLSLAPDSSALRNSIGLIYLDELQDPRAAEAEFAESVRLEPEEPAYAHNLFRAVANRSLLYRTLSVPGVYFGATLNFASKISDGCIGFAFWIFTWQLWIGLLLWIGMIALLFWPVKKAFEYLFISDILATTAVGSHKFRALLWFQRQPFSLRIGLVVGLMAAIWALVFHLIKIPIKSGFIALAIFVALNFLFVLVSQTYQRFRTRRALKLRA